MRLIPLPLALFCALLPSLSWSQALTKGGPVSAYLTPNKVQFSYPGGAAGSAAPAANNRTFSLPSVANDGVFVTDVLKTALGGAVIDVAVKSLVSPSAYPAIAVAAAAAGGYVAGTALYDYLNTNGVGVDEGGFFQTVGGQTYSAYVYRWAYNGSVDSGTLEHARVTSLQRWVAGLVQNGYGTVTVTSSSCAVSGATAYICTHKANTSNYQEYGPYQVAIQVSKISDAWCVDSTGAKTIRPTGGLCPAGTKQPLPAGDVPPLLVKPPLNPPKLVEEGLGLGAPVPAGTPGVTGPATAPGPSKTVTATGPNGVTTTNEATTNKYTYDGPTVAVEQETNKTTANPDGTTSTELKKETPTPVCGVTGYPACTVKVDEAGTPEHKAPDTKPISDLRDADAVKMNEAAQSIPTPDLGWFGAPPVAACEPFTFPGKIGALDPCGTVNSVRDVMAYLWALAAAWMSFGMIRKAAGGGA